MRRSKAFRDEIAQAALRDMTVAYAMSRAHSRLAAWAGRKYGDHGALISGVVHEHFPEPVKARLRLIARAVGELLDRSRERWRLALRKRGTWMRAKEQTIARDGRGFYG